MYIYIYIDKLQLANAKTVFMQRHVKACSFSDRASGSTLYCALGTKK